MDSHSSRIAPAELLLFLILLAGPVAHGLVEIGPVTAMQTAVIFLAAIAALTAICRGQIRLHKTPADIPIFLACAAVVAAAFTSVYPYASRLAVTQLAVYLLLFCFVVNSQRSSMQISRLAWMIAVFSGIYAFIALIMSGGSMLGFNVQSRGYYNISLFFANHSHFAGYLEMAAWLTVGLALANSGGKRLLLFALSILMAAAVAFSLSRGGIIGLIAGLAFYAAVHAFVSGKRSTALLLLSFALLVVAFLVWLGLEPVIARLQTLEDPSLAGKERVAIWQGTWQMILARPLTGWGPGTYALAFLPYQPEITVGQLVNYAHNDYLELAADAGLPCLLAALLAIFVFFISCLRRLTTTEHSFDQEVGIGALAGCFSLLIHSLTDFNFHVPSNAVLFSVLAGTAAATAGRIKDNASLCINGKCAGIGKAAVALAICSAACCCCAAVLSPYLGSRYAEEATAYQENREYDKAEAALQKAMRVDPGNAELMRFMGDLLLSEPLSGGNAPKLFARALAWYEQASKTCPTRAYYQTKIAMVQEWLGQTKKAKAALVKAIDLEPMNAFGHYNLGSLHLRQNRLDDACKNFRRFLELNQLGQLTMVLDAIAAKDSSYETLKKAVSETAAFRKYFAGYLNGKEKKEEALQELALAFSLEPTADNALTHIQGFFWKNDFAAALAQTDAYLKQFRKDNRLLEQKASILENLGRNKDAAELYQSLLEQPVAAEKNNVQYYLNIARLYAKDNHYEEAVAALRQGIKKNAWDCRLYHDLGIYLRPLQKPEESLAALKKAVSLSPQNIWCQYQLGEEYRLNGLDQKAVETWRECLKIQGDFAPCKTSVNQLLQQLGLPALE